MLDLRVPLILGGTWSMIKFPCRLYNMQHLDRGRHRAEDTAVLQVACPGILESHPVHWRQNGKKHIHIIKRQDSNAVCEALNSSAHCRDVFGLPPVLVVIEVAKGDGMFFKVFKHLELLHGTQASALMRFNFGGLGS